MPVVVSCRCGKRFAAKDHLVGKQVPCPSCGNILAVAAGPPPGIYVACACGRAFLAPVAMAGQQAHCKDCGRVIHVPSTTSVPEPLDLTSLPLGPLEPLSVSLPSLGPPPSEIPWDRLKVIAGCGAGLLAVVIIITNVWNFVSYSIEVANSPPPPAPTAPVARPPAAPASPSVVTPIPSSAAPSGSASGSSPIPASVESRIATNTEPNGETSAASTASSKYPRASVSPKTTAPAESAITRLPQGIQDWHNQPNQQLSGLRSGKPTDSPTERFSWLTALLPFVGQGKVYEQFDFKKPLDEGKNLQLAGTLIPEYLNPLDERQRWQGYPLNGMALTHFVGISGIEDARNVVAAKLPRSDSRAGVFGYDEVARPEDITDGQSQTVMIAGAGALANPWTFGGGATIRGAREPYFDKSSGLGTKGLPGGGSIVVMADGSVRHVTGKVDPKVFRAMCTIHGNDSVDLEPAAPAYDLNTLKAPK